jgi:cytochrome c oxidase subunit 1
MIKKPLILLAIAILCNVFFFALLGAHHTFVMGLNPFLGIITILLSLLIGIPIVVFVTKKLVRYCKGRIRFTPAVLFALGFFIFLIGDLFTSLFYGASTLDIAIHDTYIVITNAYVMILHSLICLVFSAVYSYYPSLTGRDLNAPMGYIHFGITMITISVVALPVHYTGLAGMPRRYLDYSNYENNFLVDRVNSFMAKLTFLLIGAQLLFVINLIYSAVKGEKRRAI